MQLELGVDIGLFVEELRLQNIWTDRQRDEREDRQGGFLYTPDNLVCGGYDNGLVHSVFTFILV